MSKNFFREGNTWPRISIQAERVEATLIQILSPYLLHSEKKNVSNYLILKRWQRMSSA